MITTNLGRVLNGVMMEQPVKRVVPKTKIQTIKEAEKKNEVINAWESLQLKIYNLFKDFKGTANMTHVKKAFADEIDFINKNISLVDVTYKLEGRYIKAFYCGQRIGQFSTQNKKLLPNSRGEGFLLWSILGHITCNGKTGLCAGFCYNNSKSFDDHLKLKIDCLILSLLDVFVPVVSKMLQLTPHLKTFVRIHEDGDFYDMEYFNKWVEIAEKNKNFTFEAYTKEPQLMLLVNSINAKYKNIVLRFSIMEDTSAEIVEYIVANEVPNYTAIGTKKKDKNAEKAFEYVALPNRCLDSCQHCKKCYTKECITIITKLH